MDVAVVVDVDVNVIVNGVNPVLTVESSRKTKKLNQINFGRLDNAIVLGENKVKLKGKSYALPYLTPLWRQAGAAAGG